MIYLWLAITIGTLLLELGHPGLFLFLSFACGAGMACFAAFCQVSVAGQIAVFISVTGISLFLLRQWIHSLHHKEVPFNGAALQGKSGLVIKHIAPYVPGQVKINGEIWAARTHDTCSFEPNTHVMVVRVSGSHVIVTALQTPRKDV